MSGAFEGGDEKRINNNDSHDGGESRPLSETAIHNFLLKNGIKKKPSSSIQRGEPLLCALPGAVRSDTGPYKDMEPKQRPCIARIDFPTRYEGGMRLFCTGQVDYYAIIDGVPTHVKTSTKKERPYLVMPREVYEAADNLFPKDKLGETLP